MVFFFLTHLMGYFVGCSLLDVLRLDGLMEEEKHLRLLT
jgi:hypothetical protein